MEVTDRMLTAAVRKAVECGLLPKADLPDRYIANWQAIKSIVEAAVSESDIPGAERLIGRMVIELRSLEWAGSYREDYDHYVECCPSCFGRRPNKADDRQYGDEAGHKPDCAIAALIA